MGDPIAVRFWRTVAISEDPDGCWLWTGPCLPSGYPRFFKKKFGNSGGYAHRAAWEIANARQIPPGMTIDHLCGTPSCVRSDHLRLATQRENILAGGGPAALNARKTHCSRGHAYDEANTYYGTNGSRQCRKCNTINNRRWRARSRARRSADA